MVVSIVIACPIVATHVWLRWRNETDEKTLVALPLVVAGLLAYVSAIAYFLMPFVGRCFALSATLGCALYAGRTMWKCHRPQVDGLRLPATLALLLGLLYLGLLYLPLLDRPYSSQSAIRFTHELPMDPLLPAIMGDRLFAGEPLRPFVGGGWSSSDRPPLQTGFYLFVLPSTRLLGLPDGLAYQCVATLAQLFWVPAAWLIVRALCRNRFQAALTVLIVATIGFFVVNSVYVWPKLLGAAFVTLSALLLFERSSARSGHYLLLATAAAVLGWLAHGSAAFSILAIAPIWLIRGCPGHKLLIVAIPLAVIIAAPWIYYQKICDPPGDRLIKWHLAGVIPVDSRSASEVLGSAYAALSWEQWIAARKANFTTLFGGSLVSIGDFFTTRSSSRRIEEFFFFFRAMGVLNLVWLFWPLVWCFRRRPLASPHLFCGLLSWLILTLGIWITLMFIPASTVLHQGSYAAMLVACVLGTVLLLDLPPYLKGVFLVWHIAYFSATWLFYFGSARTTPGMLPLIGLTSLALGLAVRWARRVDTRHLVSAERSS